MHSVIKKLHERELISCAFVKTWPFPALRSYSLFKIMPLIAQEDIFLGFSVCDSFLVSYKAEFKRYVLRFWLFPPSSIPSNNKPQLNLFADVCFSRITYTSQFHEAPCVRFIQSTLRPEMFFFLSCDCDGTGLVASFASMPDLNCSSCMAYCNALKTLRNTHTENASRCAYHGRVLLLNLDLTPSPVSPVHFSQPESTSGYFAGITHGSFIPPCYRPKDYPPRSERKQNKCHCFFSINSLIGQVQVGVCPMSGCLKLAWPSPDSQIKVLSCYFESRPDSSEPELPTTTSMLYSLPISLPTQETPCEADQRLFAFHDPVLTHNYCSTCYSWPDVSHLCTSTFVRPTIPEHHSSLSTLSVSSFSSHGVLNLSPTQCLFNCQPPSVQYVSEPSRWYETRHCHNRHQSLTCQNYEDTNLDEVVRIDKKQLTCSCSMNLHQRTIPSVLLTSRPSVFSCHRSTYLAMLQDIRASYVQWNLVARSIQPHSSYHTRPPASLLLASMSSRDGDSVTPTQLERSFPSSLSSSVDTSDSDQFATYTSPMSNQMSLEDNSLIGSWLPSEDLLAHRLSGQCHTSFDLTDWQELGAFGGGLKFSSSPSDRSIAHLEEVVFDIPMHTDSENTEEPPTGLLVLLPPDEPNLMLIYSCQQQPSPHNRRSKPISPKANSVCLISAIDLRTGRRVPLPIDTDLDLSSFVSRQHLTTVELRHLTKRCPMANARSSDSPLHELNNYQMVCNNDSLKMLRTRQGGYALHL